MILESQICNFGNTYADNMDTLNEMVMLEVYFGETAIKDLQAQLSRFRAKWIGKDWNPKINYDADLIKFNRMVEQQFGYYRFCFTVDPSNDTNAYMINIGCFATINVEASASKNLKVYKSNKGFYFDKTAQISAMATCYFGIICSKEFSDREVMSVLLHEIGHSFTYAVLNKEGALTGSSILLKACQQVSGIIQNHIKNGDTVTDDLAESDMERVSIFSLIKDLFTRKTANKINTVVHSISQTLRSKMRGNTKNYEYTNEKFADTFSSMYGYGSELNTTLQKMQDMSIKFYLADAKTPSSISIALQVAAMSYTNMIGFILGALDEHPTGLTRIQTQIDFLERELRNTGLDPVMKSELQKQLDTQKKLIDDFINYSSDEDAFKAYRVYYTKLYKKYGGDIREKYTDNQAMFDVIDSTYNKLYKD